MNYPNIYTNAKLWHEHGVTGKGVVIAVVDTGVAKHPDLELLDGFDVYKKSEFLDEHGHGTHVAGIAAGKRFGVAPGAKIIPIKIGDANGRSNSVYMTAGLDWLKRWRISHSERLIVNISFSGSSAAPILKEINELVAMGVPVCVSAGNDGGEKNPFAEYENPIVVGNMVDENTLHETSACWGDLTDCVVIGSDVMSCATDGGYKDLTGTSMAAPAVAGMLALILSRWPEMTEIEAYEYLMSLCDRRVACRSGKHALPTPTFKDDFEAREDDKAVNARETKYIAGVSEGKLLIVREGSGTGTEKAGNLANGDMVTVLAEEGAKSLVATGTCGWIPTSYLVDEPPADSGNEDGGNNDDTDSADKPDIGERNETGQVQELLHKWGFGAMVGGIDGKNGPKTKEAVRQFQSAMGLDVDGIAGPKTLAKLKGTVIKPRITEEDMLCMCAGKYCDGKPNPSTAGVRLLVERIWREHEKTRPGVVYCITNRETPAPDKAIAGGQRCEKWNAERGGASGSQHKYGRGADIMPKLDGVAAATLRQECEDIALRLNTKGGVGYGARYIVHVDVRGNKARWKY